MSGDDFIKAQCCLLAWRDGHGYGANAMIGILHVIRNRTTANGGDWLVTVQDSCNDAHFGRLQPPAGGYPDVRDPVFQILLDVVDSIYDGTRLDRLTNDANHYGDVCCRPHSTRVADIGGLIFYR